MKKTSLLSVILLAAFVSSCNNNKESQSNAEKNESGEKYIAAQVFIKPEYVSEFKAFAPELLANTRKEEGAIFYNLYQSIEDSTKFIFCEKFKNQAAFDLHTKTEHFSRFSEAMKKMAAKEAIVTTIK